MRSYGTILCLASAAAFGAMAVFGKLAYEGGATVGTLLAVRFLLAATLFWALLLATGAAAEIRALPGRDVALALALGACGYAAQAGGYFAALERLDARRLAALALACGGLVLVLAGAGTGALDPLGTTLGLGAAVVYSAYILVSESVATRVRPRLLAALVCTGAAATLTVGSAL